MVSGRATMEAMTGDATHPARLGEFLKARRAELSPRDVGLPDTGVLRRVPGLRREEVAQLAAISVDYYTRLEQGRFAASASILATLARALRLDDDQQTYLYEVAGKPTARPRRRRTQPVRPPMRRLLDQLTETPALVLGRRMDILAWNPMAAALYTDFAQLPESQRNYVRLLFTDPEVRNRHADWEEAARTSVASLRMEAAKDPDDLQLAALAGELSVQDPDFRTWWGAHQVTTASYGTKRFRHPVVGDLTLDCDTWDSPDGHEQRLLVLTAEPGTPDHQALSILAEWTAVHPWIDDGGFDPDRGDRVSGAIPRGRSA
jgi:transcriptional regulator with XRE-family HTH domain